MKNNVVLITGGAKGIGRHAALTLARAGAKLALADTDVQRLHKTSAEIKSRGGDAFAIPTDVRDEKDVRHMVLDGVQQLLTRVPNVRVLVTSRDMPDIRSRMEVLGATQLNIVAETVDADIGRYVSSQLSRDRKLSRLDLASRTLIEDTLSNKANGMSVLESSFSTAMC